MNDLRPAPSTPRSPLHLVAIVGSSLLAIIGVIVFAVAAYHNQIEQRRLADEQLQLQKSEQRAKIYLEAAQANKAGAATGREVQARIDSDVAAGRPVVVHVIVALCDNANQGIVPVPRALGDGQKPKTNLYWGALYGVRTHLPRVSSWAQINAARPEDERVLDRVVFHADVKRNNKSVPVYIVADAWDGANIREALQAFLRIAAGDSVERIEIKRKSGSLELRAGGASHLLAYVGHNGLMEFSLDTPGLPQARTEARSAMVLACASKPYFLDFLQAVGAHPLLLTTGLMAPEAYILDSAIRTFASDGATELVVESAAVAYNQYQKCGLKGARKLFWGAP